LYIISFNMEEWLLMLVLVHIIECQRTEYYTFKTQDIDSKHNLNSQKNAPAILQFLEALKANQHKSIILARDIKFYPILFEYSLRIKKESVCKPYGLDYDSYPWR